MKKVEMGLLVSDKLAEVVGKIAEFEKNEGNRWSENTCKTQIQQRKVVKDYLLIISELLENIENNEVKMDAKVLDRFKSLTTLTEARQSASIIIKDGDLLVVVLKKYSDRKFEALMKAAEKAGLKLDGNKFVKA